MVHHYTVFATNMYPLGISPFSIAHKSLSSSPSQFPTFHHGQVRDSNEAKVNPPHQPIRNTGLIQLSWELFHLIFNSVNKGKGLKTVTQSYKDLHLDDDLDKEARMTSKLDAA